jgi:hypothetical protein
MPNVKNEYKGAVGVPIAVPCNCSQNESPNENVNHHYFQDGKKIIFRKSVWDCVLVYCERGLDCF